MIGLSIDNQLNGKESSLSIVDNELSFIKNSPWE